MVFFSELDCYTKMYVVQLLFLRSRLNFDMDI